MDDFNKFIKNDWAHFQKEWKEHVKEWHEHQKHFWQIKGMLAILIPLAIAAVVKLYL